MLTQTGAMSEYADSMAPNRESSWFARMIAPQEGSGRPVSTGLLAALALAALVTFVGSLTLDWTTLTIDWTSFEETGRGVELPEGESLLAPTERQIIGKREIASGIESMATLGQVYTMGIVALLGVVGAAISRPDFALRARMAVAGITAGLAGVVLSATSRLAEGALAATGPVDVRSLDIDLGVTATSYEPGLLCAYVALVLSFATVWLSGRRAAHGIREARAAADAEPAGDAAPPTQRTPQATSSPPQHGEPLDLTVTPADTPFLP